MGRSYLAISWCFKAPKILEFWNFVRKISHFFKKIKCSKQPKKQNKVNFYFYRTRVRSLVMLVSDSLTHWLTDWLLFSGLDGCEWYQLLDETRPIIGNACQWLTDWLTNWLLFSKLDWCDPGVWRCQLKLVEVVTVADVDTKKHVDDS